MARARLYVCPAAAAANCNRPASRAPALLPQSPAKKAAAKPKAAAAPKVKKTTTTKRHLRGSVAVHETDKGRIKQMMPMAGL